MHTSLLAGTVAPDDDDTILAALASVSVVAETSPDTYVLGLRNEERAIYRRVEINGMATTIRITEALRALGFQSEPGSLVPPSHGCQIVLRRPPAVLPFGFAQRKKALWRPENRVAARPAETVVAR